MVKSVLCREMASLHTVVLSVRCASVTDKTFSLIGQWLFATLTVMKIFTRHNMLAEEQTQKHKN